MEQGFVASVLSTHCDVLPDTLMSADIYCNPYSMFVYALLAFAANKWLPIVLAVFQRAANAARASLHKKKTTPPDRSTGDVEMAAEAPDVNIEVDVENSAAADEKEWLKSFLERALAELEQVDPQADMVTKLKKLPNRMRELCERAAQERIDQQIAAAEAKGTEEAEAIAAKFRALSPVPEREQDPAQKCLILIMQTAMFLWAFFDYNTNVARDLEGGTLCYFAFYTTLPMYKPVALAGLTALLPVLAQMYYIGAVWETAPKQQRVGMNKHKPPLDSNYLTYSVTAVFAVMLALWLVAASPFLVLGLSVFAPVLIMFLVGGLAGLYFVQITAKRGIAKITAGADKEEKTKEAEEADAVEGEESELLRLKIFFVMILCSLCSLADFATIYTSGRTGWAAIAGDAMQNARNALRTDLSFSVSWPPPSLAWPSLHAIANVQLAVTIGLLALQPLLVLFSVLYNKHLSRWGWSKRHHRAVRRMQRFVNVVAVGFAIAVDRYLQPQGEWEEKRPDITEWEPILEYARRTQTTELLLSNCGFRGRETVCSQHSI